MVTCHGYDEETLSVAGRQWSTKEDATGIGHRWSETLADRGFQGSTSGQGNLQLRGWVDG